MWCEAQKSSRFAEFKSTETANWWIMTESFMLPLEFFTLLQWEVMGFCFSSSAACIHSDRYNQPSILQGHWSVHQCLGASCCGTSWLQLGSALVFEYWPGISFQQQQQPPQHHWSWMAGLSRALWWWSTTAFYLLDSKCFNHDHLHNVHILNLFKDTAKGLRVGLHDCDLFLKER